MQKRKIEYCVACGKVIDKHGCLEHKLCGKHYKQLLKYGEIKDNNQRTVFDSNEIRTFSDYAEIDTYDQFGNVIETYKFDLEDLKYIGSHKWRTIYKFSSSGNKSAYLGTGHTEYFHRLILGNLNCEIDHINRDTHDNRKCNLRPVSKQEQIFNTLKENKSGIKGVHYHENRSKGWYAECQVSGKRYYSPGFTTKEQAAYYRYLLESTYLSEYLICNTQEFRDIISELSEEEKKEVQKCFTNRTKVQV